MDTLSILTDSLFPTFYYLRDSETPRLPLFVELELKRKKQAEDAATLREIGRRMFEAMPKTRLTVPAAR